MHCSLFKNLSWPLAYSSFSEKRMKVGLCDPHAVCPLANFRISEPVIMKLDKNIMAVTRISTE
jgi:hypothetical protein